MNLIPGLRNHSVNEDQAETKTNSSADVMDGLVPAGMS